MQTPAWIPLKALDLLLLRAPCGYCGNPVTVRYRHRKGDGRGFVAFMGVCLNCQASIQGSLWADWQPPAAKPEQKPE